MIKFSLYFFKGGEMDKKKRCADAALKYIEEKMTVGLGGGTTIGYLAQLIKDKQLDIEIVTPSMKTEKLCRELGLKVTPLEYTEKIDIAFDGCDEVDFELNALKSGGGIHTKEKIIAQLVEKYILLADDSKVVSRLTFKHPVVLEMIRESLALVRREIKKLGGKFVLREAAKKDGYVISDNGNLLADIYFENVEEIRELYNKLKNIAGVVEISLFCDVVHSVIYADENSINILEVENEKI